MKVDAKNLGKALNANTKAQADALKRAAVRTLTRAAGMAQDMLIAEEKKKFKAPVPFTTNTQGYRITPARQSSAGEPQSKFGAKAKQSAYLRFTIEGGVREPGDAGTSDKFVFKPTKYAKLTASGALQRYYTKQLVTEANRKRPIRGGGVYKGSIPGHTDYGMVLRPARTLALYKIGRGGKQVLARPNDWHRVSNVNNPQMLVKFDKQSKHDIRLPYEEIMRAAMNQATSEMGRRLQEELHK